jgi:hypothetical protein
VSAGLSWRSLRERDHSEILCVNGRKCLIVIPRHRVSGDLAQHRDRQRAVLRLWAPCIAAKLLTIMASQDGLSAMDLFTEMNGKLQDPAAFPP